MILELENERYGKYGEEIKISQSCSKTFSNVVFTVCGLVLSYEN